MQAEYLDKSIISKSNSFEKKLKKNNSYYLETNSDFLLAIRQLSCVISRHIGIVQGMSGSPIIQDGKLVGAVTHVLVNDPTRGYGIFIENMLDAAG